eukprot:3785198-Amphidinium_carterae.1
MPSKDAVATKPNSTLEKAADRTARVWPANIRAHTCECERFAKRMVNWQNAEVEIRRMSCTLHVLTMDVATTNKILEFDSKQTKPSETASSGHAIVSAAYARLCMNKLASDVTVQDFCTCCLQMEQDSTTQLPVAPASLNST